MAWSAVKAFMESLGGPSPCTPARRLPARLSARC